MNIMHLLSMALILIFTIFGHKLQAMLLPFGRRPGSRPLCLNLHTYRIPTIKVYGCITNTTNLYGWTFGFPFATSSNIPDKGGFGFRHLCTCPCATRGFVVSLLQLFQF